MKNDKLNLIAGLLSQEFEDFSYIKGKRTWLQETNDLVLLLIGCQPSRTGMIFHLNFGAYFLGITPTKNPPKIPDWYLLARFERFSNRTVSEYNQLFSLEECTQGSLEERCSEIAQFSQMSIIPNLRLFENFREMRKKLTIFGNEAFESYWAQNITKAQIAAHILNKNDSNP